MAQTPLELDKAKQVQPSSIHCSNPDTKTKKISFSIIVISVPLLYVSLLHIPPSTLFNDTRFWFLISNAIILIVAADSGVLFCSSSGATDLYDEFMKHSRSQNSFFAQTADDMVEVRVVSPKMPTSTSKIIVRRRADSNKERVDSHIQRNQVFRHSKENCTPEESEYSTMSDEELNRRVEEFIKRFNRQIRMQEMRDEITCTG